MRYPSGSRTKAQALTQRQGLPRLTIRYPLPRAATGKTATKATVVVDGQSSRSSLMQCPLGAPPCSHSARIRPSFANDTASHMPHQRHQATITSQRSGRVTSQTSLATDTPQIIQALGLEVNCASAPAWASQVSRCGTRRDMYEGKHRCPGLVGDLLRTGTTALALDRTLASAAIAEPNRATRQLPALGLYYSAIRSRRKRARLLPTRTHPE